MRFVVDITPDEVWVEKDRRWGLGFYYTFPDQRGTHLIGTTPKDMEDWNKVSLAAQTSLNLGQPDSLIPIWTNTGEVMVTAMEWQFVLAAASGFMQGVIEKAGQIVNMNPIPVDFTNDEYWE